MPYKIRLFHKFNTLCYYIINNKILSCFKYIFFIYWVIWKDVKVLFERTKLSESLSRDLNVQILNWLLPATLCIMWIKNLYWSSLYDDLLLRYLETKKKTKNKLFYTHQLNILDSFNALLYPSSSFNAVKNIEYIY